MSGAVSMHGCIDVGANFVQAKAKVNYATYMSAYMLL